MQTKVVNDILLCSFTEILLDIFGKAICSDGTKATKEDVKNALYRRTQTFYPARMRAYVTFPTYFNILSYTLSDKHCFQNVVCYESDFDCWVLRQYETKMRQKNH